MDLIAFLNQEPVPFTLLVAVDTLKIYVTVIAIHTALSRSSFSFLPITTRNCIGACRNLNLFLTVLWLGGIAVTQCVANISLAYFHKAWGRTVAHVSGILMIIFGAVLLVAARQRTRQSLVDQRALFQPGQRLQRFYEEASLINSPTGRLSPDRRERPEGNRRFCTMCRVAKYIQKRYLQLLAFL